MKTIVIITNDREKEVLYGVNNKYGKSYLIGNDRSMKLSGNVNVDAQRIMSFSNTDGGVKFRTFDAYMKKEAVEAFGKWHLEEFGLL